MTFGLFERPCVRRMMVIKSLSWSCPMNFRLPLLFVVLFLGGCFGINSDVDVADGANVDRGLGTVNGSVQIGRDATVDGDVESVNGSVSVGANTAVAGNVTTVNGKISLGAGASAIEVAGVNGSVYIGENASVERNVDTVNGLVVIEAGAVVGERVSSVNGPIRLEGATAGSIRNNNGGITLERGSRVLGELRVAKSRFANADEPVTVVIHDECEVTGPLIFERSVTLRIHHGATVGEIQGAEAEYFND